MTRCLLWSSSASWVQFFRPLMMEWQRRSKAWPQTCMALLVYSLLQSLPRTPLHRPQHFSRSMVSFGLPRLSGHMIACLKKTQGRGSQGQGEDQERQLSKNVMCSGNWLLFLSSACPGFEVYFQLLLVLWTCTTSLMSLLPNLITMLDLQEYFED